MNTTEEILDNQNLAEELSTREYQQRRRKSIMSALPLGILCSTVGIFLKNPALVLFALLITLIIFIISWTIYIPRQVKNALRIQDPSCGLEFIKKLLPAVSDPQLSHDLYAHFVQLTDRLLYVDITGVWLHHPSIYWRKLHQWIAAVEYELIYEAHLNGKKLYRDDIVQEVINGNLCKTVIKDYLRRIFAECKSHEEVLERAKGLKQSTPYYLYDITVNSELQAFIEEEIATQYIAPFLPKKFYETHKSISSHQMLMQRLEELHLLLRDCTKSKLYELGFRVVDKFNFLVVMYLPAYKRKTLSDRSDFYQFAQYSSLKKKIDLLQVLRLE